MNRLLRVAILACGIWVFTGLVNPIIAQTEGNTYVTVKLYEPINKKGEIIISYGDSKSERVSIEELNSIHHENNCNTLTDVFNRLAKEGYKLVSSAGSSHGNPASILHVEAYVFVKEN